jgi:hypothetical protein
MNVLYGAFAPDCSAMQQDDGLMEEAEVDDLLIAAQFAEVDAAELTVAASLGPIVVTRPTGPALAFSSFLSNDELGTEDEELVGEASAAAAAVGSSSSDTSSSDDDDDDDNLDVPVGAKPVVADPEREHFLAEVAAVVDQEEDFDDEDLDDKAATAIPRTKNEIEVRVPSFRADHARTRPERWSTDKSMICLISVLTCINPSAVLVSCSSNSDGSRRPCRWHFPRCQTSRRSKSSSCWDPC